MRTAFRYLKEHLRGVYMCAGMACIFAVVFYLYDINMDAVEYAFLLAAIWIAAFTVADFWKYKRRHLELMELERRLKAQWEMLPPPKSLIEEDYQHILKEIYDRKLEIESSANMARQDMMDYYSLWVHQIKTPISAMRVLLQARENNGPDSGAENLEEIKALKMELFKIEQYVEMVLSYLRMESISSDMVLQWYLADDIIRQAVRKYSQLFILQKIKLELKPINQMVLTDEKWLVFVVEQILSNALKYTKNGSISIYYENEQIVIRDTGIGIQEEDIPRVFEKGFTGFNGRTDKKSTGIGLYLCKTVMDRLNHTMRIESEVGKGTKVYLALRRENLIVE